MPARTTTQPRWATRPEVAEYIRKSVRTIDGWIAAGHIPAYRLPGGRSLVIDLNDVDALIQASGPVVDPANSAA